MNGLGIDDEREVLNRRREELDRKLQALTAQKEMLEQNTYNERRDALLSKIHEVERRLVEIGLDEQSLRQMEGRE
ncbi:MAG: hypothetical protein IID38_05135 [Planctomycetes bacterium]|nr:hypothetical protein [Planctomycetota bacterium]